MQLKKKKKKELNTRNSIVQSGNDRYAQFAASGKKNKYFRRYFSMF